MDYRPKYNYYEVNVNNLKQIVVQLHLNRLHSYQLNMIDEAVNKSDLTQANEVIKHIMEKK
jgi:hypothetical protein